MKQVLCQVVQEAAGIICVIFNPKNTEAIGDKKLLEHWLPVDLYIGEVNTQLDTCCILVSGTTTYMTKGF